MTGVQTCALPICAQRPLEGPASQPGISILVEHTRSGSQESPLAVGLEGSPLQDDGTLEATGSKSIAQPLADALIEGDLVLAAPAVEVEAQCAEPSVRGVSEKWRGVAYPAVAVIGRQVPNVTRLTDQRTRALFDLIALDEQPDRLVASVGDCAAQRRDRMLRFAEMARPLFLQIGKREPAGRVPLPLSRKPKSDRKSVV